MDLLNEEKELYTTASTSGAALITGSLPNTCLLKKAGVLATAFLFSAIGVVSSLECLPSQSFSMHVDGGTSGTFDSMFLHARARVIEMTRESNKTVDVRKVEVETGKYAISPVDYVKELLAEREAEWIAYATEEYKVDYLHYDGSEV